MRCATAERNSVAVRADPDVGGLLDDIRRCVLAGQGAEGMRLLQAELRHLRLSFAPESWAQIVARCQAHPLRKLVHEDPFTARAFDKPRGYPGDAVMLDYVYSPERLGPTPEMSRSGALVWAGIVGSQTSQAVRARRHLIARMIDRTAMRIPNSRILCLAAGHLREAELSQALQSGRVGELLAVDQDPLSLAVIARDYAALPVRTMPGNVSQLATDTLPLGDFDLVYAAGLFDYFHDARATAVLRQMLAFTRPGGEVLIANLLPAHDAIGYMEAYMDWKVVPRTAADLHRLASEVTPLVGDVWVEPEHETIGYLRIRRP